MDWILMDIAFTNTNRSVHKLGQGVFKMVYKPFSSIWITCTYHLDKEVVEFPKEITDKETVEKFL
jgi:hypothetical protein